MGTRSKALPGRRALVVGASNIVGRPMALELPLAGATPTAGHRSAGSTAERGNEGELLVVAESASQGWSAATG